MRILEYKTHKQIFAKAEITNLTPFPIDNNTDDFYLVIPTISSELPNNVMFIQEILLVNPHTTINYSPKIVKLGVTLSQSLATPLPKGIEIKIVIIDNIKDELYAVTSIDTIKSKIERKKKDSSDSISHPSSNSINTYVSDGSVIRAKDKSQYEILQSIDRVIESKENTSNTNKVEIQEESRMDNSNLLRQEDEETTVKSNYQETNSTTVPIVVKKGRGRPRKNPVVEQDGLAILQSNISHD